MQNDVRTCYLQAPGFGDALKMKQSGQISCFALRADVPRPKAGTDAAELGISKNWQAVQFFRVELRQVAAACRR